MVNHCLHIISVVLLFFIFPGAYSQDVSYKQIDDFVKSYPIRPSSTGDIRVLAREIRRQFKGDDELARAAYYWIAHNISYDCEGYRAKNGLYKLEEVLAQHRGICAGYAELMRFFCTELGVECKVVQGFAAGIGVTSIHADSLKSNHAWNVVKVKGKWKLVDPTWGSGSANSDCTKTYPEFREKYFFSNPDEFIITHFPDSACWQLKENPLTRQQFSASVAHWKKANEDDQPRDSVIKRNTGEMIRFLFQKKDERNTIGISIYKKKGDPEYVFDSIQVDRDGSYFYDYKVKYPGYYRVEVSLFNNLNNDMTMVGTTLETYFLDVNTGKKNSVLIKKGQK